MRGTIHPEVRDYLADVRRHLGDLPEDELDDLTIDLESHLAEVSAEGAGSLRERLGSPAAYAAELRTSAGFERARPVPSVSRWVAAHAQELAARPAVVRARRAWREFRPVWVAIRAWLIVVLWMITVGGSNEPFRAFPIPNFGGTLGGLALVAALTVLSLRAARRAREPWWRRIDVLLTGATVALLLLALASGAGLDRDGVFVVEDFSADDVFAQLGPLATATNIYAYDLEGNPLSGVLLYDQDGNPLDIYPWYDGDQPEVRFPEDRYGDPIKNAYPLDVSRVVAHDDFTGEPELAPQPAPRVPLPDLGRTPAAPSPAAPRPAPENPPQQPR